MLKVLGLKLLFRPATMQVVRCIPALDSMQFTAFSKGSQPSIKRSSFYSSLFEAVNGKYINIWRPDFSMFMQLPTLGTATPGQPCTALQQPYIHLPACLRASVESQLLNCFSIDSACWKLGGSHKEVLNYPQSLLSNSKRY